jgi:hypothetical protein
MIPPAHAAGANIREPQRVDGKPTTVNQVYLGATDKVETLGLSGPGRQDPPPL